MFVFHSMLEISLQLFPMFKVKMPAQRRSCPQFLIFAHYFHTAHAAIIMA